MGSSLGPLSDEKRKDGLLMGAVAGGDERNRILKETNEKGGGETRLLT